MKQIQRIVIAFIVVAIICLMYFHAPAQTIPVKIISATGVIDTTGMNLNGKDGKDGRDGKDGINGKDGKDGATGPMGPAGPAGSGSGVVKPSCVFQVYNASDIDAAINGVIAGTVTKIEFMQTDIVKNISIPKSWGGNSKFLIIEGNGANLKGWIKQQMPASQSEAEDLMTQYKIIVQNLSFEAPNDTCLALYGSMNNDVKNNRFRRAKSAVHLGFCMNAMVYHNDAVNMTGTAFVANRLYVTGAGLTNAQSNNATFMHNRVFNADSCFASFASYSSNNIDYWKNTVEGKKPQYGFYNDDHQSSTVKMYSHYGNHCETTALNSMFYTKLNDGVINYENTWNQKASPNLYEVVSGAGAIVNVLNNPNILSSDKFKATTTTKWNIWNNKRFDETTIWNGAAPTQVDLRYYYQGGYKWVNAVARFNNQRIQTAP